jgi:hypothetical protein
MPQLTGSRFVVEPGDSQRLVETEGRSTDESEEEDELSYTQRLLRAEVRGSRLWGDDVPNDDGSGEESELSYAQGSLRTEVRGFKLSGDDDACEGDLR